MVFLSRWIPTSASDPTGVSATIRGRSRTSRTGLPPNWRITSPGRMPARSAGESESTSDTSAPWASGRSGDPATEEVTCLTTTPNQPRVTFPRSLSWSRTRLAWLLGMAKPNWLRGMMAVVIPTTSPRRLNSGPPEFPGLMAASVWM